MADYRAQHGDLNGLRTQACKTDGDFQDKLGLVGDVGNIVTSSIPVASALKAGAGAISGIRSAGEKAIDGKPGAAALELAATAVNTVGGILGPVGDIAREGVREVAKVAGVPKESIPEESKLKSGVNGITAEAKCLAKPRMRVNDGIRSTMG
jgi:hypothetical protein